MQYIVIYEQTPRNWSAYVPDLPACVAAAKTRKGTERLIRGAIKMYLEACVEYNKPIPQPGARTGTVEVEIPGTAGTQPETEARPDHAPRKRVSA